MTTPNGYPRVVVAGHICLDVIPPITAAGAALAPGALVEVGPALLSTGGAVSNTGLALHRLGVPVSLMGKIGRDLFGGAVLDVLRRHDEALARQMIVDDAASTSYSVVISPADTDRTFLHCAGANDTFTARDIDPARLDGARVFHFGYPPLMRTLREDGGVAMAEIFGEARRRGVLTSLDMALPDPSGPSGRVDWNAWLRHVLPHVDLFLPSHDEIAFMLGGSASPQELANRLIEMGVAVAVIKLGDKGLYLRTGDRAATLFGEAWSHRELLAPCFEAQVVGTTGSGDCTIAGFLAAIVEGASPEAAATLAVAVGACSVEAADATGGVPTLETVRQRMAAGWRSRDCGVSGFTPMPGGHVWTGPRDAGHQTRLEP